jgi:hypothetical protein
MKKSNWTSYYKKLLVGAPRPKVDSCNYSFPGCTQEGVAKDTAGRPVLRSSRNCYGGEGRGGWSEGDTSPLRKCIEFTILLYHSNNLPFNLKS